MSVNAGSQVNCFSNKHVDFYYIFLKTAISGQKTLLAAHPYTTIAIPSTRLIHLVSKMLVLKNSHQFFDIDKADLVFFFWF
jgi:hypothetical protein